MRSTMSTGRSQDKSNASSLLDDTSGVRWPCTATGLGLLLKMKCIKWWSAMSAE